MSKCIYEDNEIQTNIKKKEIKASLLLCTNNTRFNYNDVIFQQFDAVAMGLILRPVLAQIFTVHLELKLIPKLTRNRNPWKRNDLHKNIKFT